VQITTGEHGAADIVVPDGLAQFHDFDECIAHKFCSSIRDTKYDTRSI
jgi:hypothetical protein